VRSRFEVSKWELQRRLLGSSLRSALEARTQKPKDEIQACLLYTSYPGRNPIFFNPYVSKDDSVLSVGRLLDAGKQVFLLTQHAHPFSVCIVGAEQTVPLPRIPIRADVKVSTDQSCVAIRGAQTESQLRALDVYKRQTCTTLFLSTLRLNC